MFEQQDIKRTELDKTARALLEKFPNQRIFAFYGTMGAGKTTFIQSLCRALGSVDLVTSPSFAIINEYTTSNGSPVYHFDFYRIKNMEEAYDLGYEDYFYSNEYCLIEWPERVEPLLPKSHVAVSIEITTHDTRTIGAKQVL
jgi:tRNA threonylcarbamoyladenosine biosynthesis protein TsaE